MKKNINAFSVIRPMLTFSVVGSTLAASAAMVALSFAVPLTVLQAYDRIIAFRSFSTLTWLTLGCLAALALNGLLEYGRGKLSAWTATRFIRKTDMALINTFLNTEPDRAIREGAERHLERFRTLGRIANVIIARSLPVAAEAPFFLAYIALLVFIGGWASLPSIAAGLIELMLALSFRETMWKTGSQYEQAERERVSYLAYALERIHFIKAQALEHVVLRGFERVQADEVAANSNKISINRNLDELSHILTSFTTFGTILWGGVLVARGSLTVGAVSACLFFASRAVGIARNIRRTAFALKDAQADLVELSYGLALPARKNKGDISLPRNVEGQLEFDSVKYINPDSGNTIINRLTFRIRPGVFASVSGEMGRSVCRLAAGIITPTSGQVLIDAYQSTSWNFLGSHSTVSYVSRQSSVLPGTILENIAGFETSRREGALDVAQLFNLDKIVSRLPRGFETEISPNNSGGLSASALRLVTIARALALRPRLLIWDSADLELDQEARASVLSVLQKLHGATTMLIHSSDPAFINLSEMIIIDEAEPV